MASNAPGGPGHDHTHQTANPIANLGRIRTRSAKRFVAILSESLDTFLPYWAEIATEVSLRERAARSGFQVFLESHGFAFGAKLDGDDNRPRAMRDRVTGRAMVMPLEAGRQIVRNAHVVTRRIGLAPYDVHDPLFDSMHGDGRRTGHAVRKVEEIGKCMSEVRELCEADKGGKVAKSESA